MSYLSLRLESQKRGRDSFFPELPVETSPDPFLDEGEPRPEKETLPAGIRSMDHWLDLNA